MRLDCLVSRSVSNARINRARRTADRFKFSMKAALFALRLNELLCCSTSFRRAERLSFLGGNLIADAECHALSSWVDSIHLNDQPASRIIHPTFQSHNRGAAGDFFDGTRSGDITPGITRRARNVSSIQVLRMTLTPIAVGCMPLFGCP